MEVWLVKAALFATTGFGVIKFLLFEIESIADAWQRAKSKLYR